ncbi:MAG: SDR family oxidoreductase [bacterium]|nr:SDR family oxidoreductase [bacterium]
MPGRLADKVLVISGSTGMAAAIAELAAREGARLFIIGLDQESCESLAQRCLESCEHADYCVGDLTDAASARDAVAQCVERFGQIDALANIAGGSGRGYGDGPLHECSEEGWDKTLADNLKTMFLLSRHVVRRMLVQPIGADGLRGAILNMGSVLAFSPQPDFFASHAYATAKGGIVSMTVAMASYYAKNKIRANVIAPGLVRTPMSKRAQSNPEIMDFMERKQPLAGGILDAEAVAEASIFLLSDESRHITGEVLTVDGGWRIA